MTGLSGDMEKQARLLSSQLVLGDRLVEVAATRTALAWKGIKKDKKSSEISISSKTGKRSKTWTSVEITACLMYEEMITFTNKKRGFLKKNQFVLH